VVTRELTKLHEEVRRESVAAAIAHFAANNPRGEFVIIIPPTATPHPNPLPQGERESEEEADPLAQMDTLVDSGLSPAAAAKKLAAQLHLSRRELYRQYIERQH
jgi:16S rRNA (cytidine1402-2'-O)-methyltransferase